MSTDAWRSELPIVGVDVARCSLPLVDPVRFGSASYATREYGLLRARTDGHVDGFACVTGRGTPLAAAMRSLAESLIGRDPLMRRELVSQVLAGNVPERAGPVRAHSLIDLALWDVTAKVAGLPLHLLLGGMRERIPALAVAGYLGPCLTWGRVEALADGGWTVGT